MKLVPFLVAAVAFGCTFCAAYNVSPTQRPVSRRDFGFTSSAAAAAAILGTPGIASGFEGSGSSAYTGKTATTKAELQKSYRARIAADVGDFNTLGVSIQKGETDGAAWVNFFIPFARREPDSVGRAYGAQADLVGAPDRSGCGYLYAASLIKPGKPPENSPGVKKFNTLAKSLAAVQVDGKKGDAGKAQKDFDKAAEAFSDFLGEVGMPSSLSDDLYK